MQVRAHVRAQKIDDAASPRGSEGWARTVRDLLREAIAYEVNYADRAWSYLDELEESKGWRLLSGADGKPFTSLRSFAEHPKPEGLGVTFERVRYIQREHRKARETFVEAEATKDPVPPPLPGPGRGNKSPLPGNSLSERGNRAEYLAGRIKARAAKGDETARAVADAVERGEYDDKGMKAAARDAGVLKPPNPIRIAVRAVAAVPFQRLAEFARALPVGAQRALVVCLRDSLKDLSE